MYRYIYEEAIANGIFRVANHREIIEKYSQKGYRFVTAIPSRMSSYGIIKAFDLVFEKLDEDID